MQGNTNELHLVDKDREGAFHGSAKPLDRPALERDHTTDKNRQETRYYWYSYPWLRLGNENLWPPE